MLRGWVLLAFEGTDSHQPLRTITVTQNVLQGRANGALPLSTSKQWLILQKNEKSLMIFFTFFFSLTVNRALTQTLNTPATSYWRQE